LQEHRVTATAIHDTLRDRFGLDSFREGQQEVIEAVLTGRDALVVMPTGSGKSLIYQLAALHLPGLTLVISPLIALMKDQIDKLRETGIDAWAVNSTLSAAEREEVERAIGEEGGKILYLTPERFRDREFFEILLRRKVSLMVVDEAHCISQWGHDFRPDYMMLGGIARRLGDPPLLALTATAPTEVQDDVAHQLGMEDPLRVIAGLIRPNLRLEVIPTVNQGEKDAALERLLRETEGTGIVYTATVKEAERLHEALSERWEVGLYHGRRPHRERTATQEAFMAGDLKAVIATNAFGLGIDKADIRFVVHYHFPGSLEAYYQEAGRAGRDGEEARCTILYRVEDRAVQGYFLGGKYPDIAEAGRVAGVMNQLPENERHPLDEIAEMAEVPRRKARIVLMLLKRHGMVREHRGGDWERIAPNVAQAELGRELDDYEVRREKDRAKLRAMIDYCQTAGCRTRIIMAYFGLDVADDFRCGHCDRCLGGPAAEVRRAPETDPGSLPGEEDAEGGNGLSTGEEVRHATFGTGIILSLEGDRAEVDFAGHGVRTIRKDFLTPV
jgi:ATP-dependent DNA helicase RecQ